MSRYNADYQKRYYQRNKRKLAARKKKRYNEDPEYRKAIKQRAAVRAALRSLRTKTRPKPTIEHGGKTEKVYYLNQVEETVNRDRDCLYNWQRGSPSLLPPALYEDTRGRRMYSDSQIKYLAKLVHRVDTGQLRITYREMRRILQEVWEERFSEGRLTRAIGEVLHGKYYEEDRKEDRRRQKEGRQRQKKSRQVPTKAELAED